MSKKVIKISFLLIILIFGLILINYLEYQEDLLTDIVFFGVGKADSILIRNNSKTMLIDTGTKEERKELTHKLEQLGVKKIDYLILTHPDKDHIGGAYYIIDNYQVGKLLQSKFVKGNKAEVRLKESINNNPLENIVITGSEDYKFDLGDLKVTIYPPMKDSYKKSNDYSLVAHIEDGELNYLFTGDAEKKLLSELLKRDLPTMDMYKVPHHGRLNDNSIKMIEKIGPKFAVITNEFGDEKVVEALENQGATIFYAYDEDISFVSDGIKLEYK